MFLFLYEIIKEKILIFKYIFFLTDSDTSELTPSPPHPTGIVLKRVGYYTIPAMEKLAELVDSEGRCIVDNFTVGRLNYGNVFYAESFDVAGLNLDEIGICKTEFYSKHIS